MPANHDFADYCCELLGSLGLVVGKRMFGSWGLSVDGMMVALVSDRGAGEKLWLKANDETRGRFEAARSERFSYLSHKGAQTVVHDMNYYSAPEDAMDSVHAMAPWARLALESALAARLTSPKRSVAPRRTGKAPPKKPQG
ncbi:MAG: TfoX/Sxy family protein [Rhodoferax sp.]|nr:TfoX/Sxy family protein [Rhodoferax sp.]